MLSVRLKTFAPVLAMLLLMAGASWAIAAEQVDLGIITVKDKVLAEKLRKQLAGGGSFEQLARKYSVGVTASRGGRLGLVPLKRLRLEYRQAVRGLLPGKPSQVVPTEEGYTILMRFQPAAVAEKQDKASVAARYLQSRQAVMAGVENMIAGDYKKAEGNLSKALGLNPYESSADFMLQMVRRALSGKGNKRAVGDFGAGFNAMVEGKAQLAADLFHRAAQIDPGLWQAKLFEANMLASMGKLKAAGEMFKQVQRAKPDSAYVYISLGIWYSENGQPKEAEVQFKNALSINPEQPQAHYELGALYLSQRKYKDAANHFTQSLAADPYSAQVHSDLGLAMMYLQNANGSEKHLKRALELNPAFAQAHINLGNLYARTDRLDLAIDEYNKALNINPNIALAHTNLAAAYALKKQWTKAITHADQSLKLGFPPPMVVQQMINPHRPKPKTLLMPKSAQ